MGASAGEGPGGTPGDGGRVGLALVAGYVAGGLIEASRSHARAGRGQDASSTLARAGRVADAAASAVGALPQAGEALGGEIEVVLDGQLALTAEIARARELGDLRLGRLLEAALEHSITEAHEAGMDHWERRILELGSRAEP